MSKEVTVKSGASVGFGGLLTILFIALKLCGVIAWNWWWVLSPLWIPVVVVLGVLAVVGLFMLGVAAVVAVCGGAD